MKTFAIFVVFTLVGLVASSEHMTGGVNQNTDHSAVENLLKNNLHLLKNQQGENVTGLS
jgi:hypothetical protein